MTDREPDLLFALLTGRTPSSLCCTQRDVEVLQAFISDGPKTPEQMRTWLAAFVEDGS